MSPSPSAASAACAECGEGFSHWNHADKNRGGHLFNSSGIRTLSGRVFAPQPVRAPARPCRRRNDMPSLRDYKFWVRSYQAQKVIRDMAAERVRQHELAGERLAEENDLRAQIAALVMRTVLDFVAIREAVARLEGVAQEREVLEGLLAPPDVLETCKNLSVKLTEKLQIRKRPPENEGA